MNSKCAPRNVLFCCRSPICLNNNSPQLVPPTAAAAAAMEQAPASSPPSTTTVHPVRVPDLSDPMFYTNLMTQPTTDATAAKSIPINKSQSAQDVRHGVSLRRVTPPKCTVTVKKSDAPCMGVVLRKVEKKLLEPPKPAKHEKSPPPRKLTNAATALGLSTSKASTSATSASAKSKKSNNPSANSQSAAIAKSKSTNDVHGKPPKDKVGSAAALTTCASAVDLKPPPPVDLRKTYRPPLEIHKIEGDKIIIIRRVPRSRRGHGQEPKSARSLPSLPLPSNQVTICCHFANPPPSSRIRSFRIEIY